ncbi:hypothetical protein [Zeimonas arvi]|uniref:hypothetical protein n=1 Tax=Zeimonas arvi TaxID=2498847 RepID=UPI00164F4CFC|nr:hypothetical protein [Zeimonas arvi]
MPLLTAAVEEFVYTNHEPRLGRDEFKLFPSITVPSGPFMPLKPRSPTLINCFV